MLRAAHALFVRSLALVALLALGTFVPLTTGLIALGDEDCDCASRHEDGDDEDHCPPFCGSCLDCAGCFHVHAIVTAPPAALSAPMPVPVRLAAATLAARPPESPSDEPVHVPRPLA